MRRGAEIMSQQNALVCDGLIKVALAEAEAGRASWTEPSRSWTKRSRRPNGPGIARSKRSSLGAR